MTRRVDFTYPDDFNPQWHSRLPEFACAANAVSLMMPFAEPYVVKSVRTALPHLEPELASQTREYLAQELQHHAQHRRFNDLLVADEPGLARLERWMRGVFGWLHRSRSDAFNVAFAAGFETVAYTSARWTEARLDKLMTGADDVAATLFLWHLAEEVEHKTVAFDVYQAVHGKRRTYVAGLITSMFALAIFAALGTAFLLYRKGRFFRPVAHWRMLVWTVSFTFELLPAMAVSTLKGHNPAKLADPPFFKLWLRQLEADPEQLPVWSDLDA